MFWVHDLSSHDIAHMRFVVTHDDNPNILYHRHCTWDLVTITVMVYFITNVYGQTSMWGSGDFCLHECDATRPLLANNHTITVTIYDVLADMTRHLLAGYSTNDSTARTLHDLLDSVDVRISIQIPRLSDGLSSRQYRLAGNLESPCILSLILSILRGDNTITNRCGFYAFTTCLVTFDIMQHFPGDQLLTCVTSGALHAAWARLLSTYYVTMTLTDIDSQVYYGNICARPPALVSTLPVELDICHPHHFVVIYLMSGFDGHHPGAYLSLCVYFSY